MLARILPVTRHEHQIALVGDAVAHLFVQIRQRGTFLCQQQQAGRVAVQAVHQFQELGVGARGAQLLDHAERHARAAMHGHAGRLVDDEQLRIFEDDLEFGGRRARGRLFGHAHGWNAHHVAGGETVQLIDTAFINPHFSRSQDPVDVAFRHSLAHS